MVKAAAGATKCPGPNLAIDNTTGAAVAVGSGIGNRIGKSRVSRPPASGELNSTWPLHCFTRGPRTALT